ncbi:MAG: DUF5808 domain-containing protein [Thermoplasmata archaeon]|nr:DUF5808 domain-containing protein [Thermoplasmata archaeon]
MLPLNGVTLGVLLLLGLLAYATWAIPVVSPASLAFGVRVPAREKAGPALLEILRGYRVDWLAVTVGLAAIAALLLAVSATPLVLISLELVVAPYFLVYYLAYRRVRELKRVRGWAASSRDVAVVAVGEPEAEDGLMLGAVVPLGVLLAEVVAGLFLYAGAPALLPTHFDSSGIPNSYAPKSIGVFFLPVELSAGVTALLLGLTYLSLRAPLRLDPASPEASALRSRVFLRRMRWGLFGLCTVVNLSIFFAGLATWGLAIPAGLVVTVPLLLLVGYAVVFATVAIRTGQMGSRVAVAGAPAPSFPNVRDDDRYWRAGAIYYNPGDSAILVPKRAGVGWTLNFGRPAAWLILLVPILLAIFVSFVVRHG